MFTFRIYIWRDGGFWNEPQYATGPDSRTIRRRMEKQHGREVASKSSVTAIAPHPIDSDVAAA